MYMQRILNDVSNVAEIAASDGCVPTGAFGTIHGATFALQRDGASPHRIRLTEDLAVAMLRLEWGIRRGDPEAIERGRSLLRDLRAALLAELEEGASSLSELQ